MPERRILTVHSPVPPTVLDPLLTSVEQSLRRSGAARVWLDCRWSPELVVMAELPERQPSLAESAAGVAT